MPAREWAAPAAAFSAVPLVVLAVLTLAGAVAPLPALLAALAVLLGAAGLAALWRSDLDRMGAALDRAIAGAPEPGDLARPWLPSAEGLTARIARVARRLRERSQEVERALRASEAIIEHLPDPLVVLDGQRAVLRANAAAHADFGAELPAALRHPVLRAAIDRAWQRDTPQSADLTVPPSRELQATVIPFAVPLPDGTRALVVLSDRTRERAVERMRADFVANASHELRTPLASLMGFVETLRGPAADDPPAQARFLAIMAEQAARMNRLIDDLLSLSRIELSEHTPPSERVDLAAVAARVVATFEVRLADRRQTLALDVAKDLPAVLADADQMAQVLTNLVDNAVKYGREGGTVAVSLALAADGVVMTVRDDGPGIARPHLPRLTERFYRVDKGRSRGAGGTGLGLAIVKHIVNRHRGRLVIDSEEGHGACFAVTLPAAVPSPQSERP